MQIIEKNASNTITSTKNFIWCGSSICEERDASNNVTKRFYGQGEQIAGTSYYYTRDHLGSIREMTDNLGNIAARYDYDPYGRTTLVQGTNLSDFQYAGMYEHQASGLNLTLYRAYDPNTARWLNRDPAGESGGLNLYGYVANSPINLIDPLGLDPSPSDVHYAGQPQPGDASNFQAAGKTLTASGLVATGMEQFGPKVGDNLAVYTSDMARGNASYGIVANLGDVGEAFGPAGYITGSLVDGLGVINGQVSPGEASMNAAMGYIGLTTGPEGVAISSAYFANELGLLPDCTSEELNAGTLNSSTTSQPLAGDPGGF